MKLTEELLDQEWNKFSKEDNNSFLRITGLTWGDIKGSILELYSKSLNSYPMDRFMISTTNTDLKLIVRFNPDSSNPVRIGFTIPTDKPFPIGK